MHALNYVLRYQAMLEKDQWKNMDISGNPRG